MSLSAQNLEGDFDFLPLIYDIIKSLEKEQTGAAQKIKDAQEASQKIVDLQRKLDQARELIKRLPGIELSKEDQLQQMDLLRKQLALKRDLIEKYRSFTLFNFEGKST